MKFRASWFLVTLCFLLSFELLGASQTSSDNTAAATPVVPPLIHFSNVANDEGGNPLAGKVTITFSLYSSPRGGEALWTETREVELDATGHYSVQLGITKTNGVPAALFASGEARWLGVQIGEQAEEARVLLVSVPYALKAADAQTLGGLPPAAFLRAPAFENGSADSTTAPTAASSASHAPTAPPPLGGSGTVNFVPLWTPDGNTLGNSLLFQSGSGSSGKIGIGNTTPSSKLDVSGGAIVRGTLKLPSNGTATANAGANSQTLNLVASAFSTSTSAAVNQIFVWQAEPTFNDTSSPGGTLNLLFGQGTAAPAETGLQFSSLGVLQITKAGTGLVVNQTGDDGGGDASTLVGEATGIGSTVKTVGVAGSAAGDLGTGVSGIASGTFGVAVNAHATGSSGFGLQATADGANGIAIVARGNATNSIGLDAITGAPNSIGVFSFADAGTGGEFINSSSTNPTITALNHQPNAPIFQAFTGPNFGTKVMEVSSAGISLVANGATTTMGNVGCNSGFVGLSLGGALGCNGYALVGNGATTILNRSAGGRIDFRENNINQMTIAAGGKVGIGTVTPAVQFDVFATTAGLHAPMAQFGSAAKTDSNSLRVYNGSGATEIFAVGGANNFIPGSAAGDGGLRVSPGHFILFGDSGLSRMIIDASGNVHVTGNLSKGGGSFQIDHPLDPKNKYLYHSFVESPDMKNVYDGNVTTDKHGLATVVLPDYFEALNRDYRYQLTVIGQFAQAMVAREIGHGRFTIRTSKPLVKVSWQVTGIRQDPYANAHRIQVEEEKAEADRGHYLHPEAYLMNEKESATVAAVSAR